MFGIQGLLRENLKDRFEPIICLAFFQTFGSRPSRIFESSVNLKLDIQSSDVIKKVKNISGAK